MNMYLFATMLMLISSYLLFPSANELGAQQTMSKQQFLQQQQQLYEPITFPFESTDRWNKILAAYAKPCKNSADLEKLIFCVCPQMGDAKALHVALQQHYKDDTFFTQTLPFIQSLVLKLPTLFVGDYAALSCEQMPVGKIKMERIFIPVHKLPDWKTASFPLQPLTVHPTGSIEDSTDALQADFANEYIGGAAISYGCVQEEIRFSICPELIVSRLFCPIMQDTEAIILTGAEQFSSYTGYAFTLGYGGDYQDKNMNPDGSCKTALVALDALIVNYRKEEQYKKALVEREMNKVHAACYNPASSTTTTTTTPAAFSTGNWGCGAFGGDDELKAITQWIPASVNGRATEYYTFKRKNLDNNLPAFVDAVQKASITTTTLFDALCKLDNYRSVNGKVPVLKALGDILKLKNFSYSV